MVPYVLLLAGVFGAKGETDLPPQPDFGALIPQTSASLPASERHEWEPVMREAAALAKYMNRCWNSAKSLDELSKYVLDLLTIAAQFDALIVGLNPNPTVAEAVARVRAYHQIIAVVRHRLKLAATGTDEWKLDPPPPGRFGLDDHLYRFRERIKRQYGPLFARAV